jgi:hypothetical protein
MRQSSTARTINRVIVVLETYDIFRDARSKLRNMSARDLAGLGVFMIEMPTGTAAGALASRAKLELVRRHRPQLQTWNNNQEDKKVVAGDGRWTSMRLCLCL